MNISQSMVMLAALGFVSLCYQILVQSTTLQKEKMASQVGILPLKYDATPEKIQGIMSKPSDGRVPNVMHFVWTSITWEQPLKQPPVPGHILERVDAWEKFHPTWHLIIWTNQSFRQYFPEVYEAMSDAGVHTPSWASNLMRYHVVARFGGVYLDTDILPLRPIPPGKQYPFTVCEDPHTYDPSVPGSPGCESVGTAVIASPQGNDEIRNVAIEAVQRTKQHVKWHGKKARYDSTVSGPPFWTKITLSVSSTFKVLPKKIFYPCFPDDKTTCIVENSIDDPLIVGVHLWEYSWKQEAEVGPNLDLYRTKNPERLAQIRNPKFALKHYQQEKMASQVGILPLKYDATPEKIQGIMSKPSDGRVPNVMHFVWTSITWEQPLKQPPVPGHILERVDAWEKFHPTWHLIIWTNQSFRQYFPEVYEAMSDAGVHTPSWASNLMRYHVVARFGGVYLDTDILPLRPIPPGKQYPFTVCEAPRTFDSSVPGSPGCERVGTAVIASPQGNDEIQNVATDALERTKQYLKWHSNNHWTVTGPPYWSNIILSVSSSFKLLPPKIFYPCYWDDEPSCIQEDFTNMPWVFGIYLWESSWKLEAGVGPSHNQVSCGGGHVASTCADCPNGNDSGCHETLPLSGSEKAKANGEDDQMRKMQPKESLQQYSVLFLTQHPEWASGHLCRLFINEWKRHNIFKFDSWNDDTAKCGHNSRSSSDICIFIGPCDVANYPMDYSNCKKKVLNMQDKYLFKKDIIDGNLHEFDALIVNNKYSENYFRRYMRFKGEILVLYHFGDPRWQATKIEPKQEAMSSHPSTLKFGYIGSINPSSLHGNFLYLDELKERYSIAMVDTADGTTLPTSANDIQMDINLRESNSTFAKFKPASKVATAATLGHNIITTWDQSVKDCLPDDYPFALKEDVTLESIMKMFDLASKDYEGDQILWKRGLRMMEEVKQQLSFHAIASEYEHFLKGLFLND